MKTNQPRLLYQIWPRIRTLDYNLLESVKALGNVKTIRALESDTFIKTPTALHTVWIVGTYGQETWTSGPVIAERVRRRTPDGKGWRTEEASILEADGKNFEKADGGRRRTKADQVRPASPVSNITVELLQRCEFEKIEKVPSSSEFDYLHMSYYIIIIVTKVRYLYLSPLSKPEHKV